MDTLKTVLNLIEKYCFLASLDLKDAYYSVPVMQNDRKYLSGTHPREREHCC